MVLDHGKPGSIAQPKVWPIRSWHSCVELESFRGSDLWRNGCGSNRKRNGETTRTCPETVKTGKHVHEFFIRCRSRGQIEEAGLVAASECHTAWLFAHRIAIGVVLVHFWFWVEVLDIACLWWSISAENLVGVTVWYAETDRCGHVRIGIV